jgi:hypothetical protein
MGHQQMGFTNITLEEFIAKLTDTGSGIQNKDTIAYTDFNTTGIATVLDVLDRRASN